MPRFHVASLREQSFIRFTQSLHDFFMILGYDWTRLTKIGKKTEERS
jgi:hypothetical protein